jgi:DNA-binding CsgD family transcriptional regulator
MLGHQTTMMAAVEALELCHGQAIRPRRSSPEKPVISRAWQFCPRLKSTEIDCPTPGRYPSSMFASNERDRLATLWDELIAGTCKIESWSYSEREWSIEVSRQPRPSSLESGLLRGRDIEILERALLSGARKQVAVEAGLSCSSIAVIMQGCFHYMGLTCLPSRIPGLLVAAAHARHAQTAKPRPASRPLEAQVFSRETIRVTRPDAELYAWLAPAEHAVIHSLIEGLTYSEIARLRHTSVRTVANQVASGFRRLQVSGRAELLCLLASWGLQQPARPTERPPSVPAPAARRHHPGASPRGGPTRREQRLAPP